MTNILRVLSTETRDMTSSIGLKLGNNTFLFNCPEGLQRLASGLSYNLTSVREIFICSNRIENIGGLTGMLLTINEQLQFPPTLNISVYSLIGINEHIALTKKFTTLRDIKGYEYIEKPSEIYHWNNFSNKIIDIFPILLTNKINSESILSFLIVIPPKPRQILKEKVTELKIPPGPLLAKLKEGKSVILDDGREIFPDQVLGPENKKNSILFLKIPNKSFLISLEENIEKILKMKQTFHIEINMIYHSTSYEVITDSLYLEIIEKIGLEALQIIDSKEVNSKGYQRYSSELFVKALGTILPKHFCPFAEASMNLSGIKEEIISKFKMKNIIFSEFGMEFALPSFSSSKDKVVSKDKVENLGKLIGNLFVNFPQQLIEEINKKENLGLKKLKNDPRFIFFGTSSLKPDKYRNTSCIYIGLQKENNIETGILLDSGENSYGQICDKFGEKANSFISMIKLIYITHSHADHNLGLFKILEIIDSSQNFRSLLLILPDLMMDFTINFISKNLKNKNQIILISNKDLSPDPSLHYIKPQSIDILLEKEQIDSLISNYEILDKTKSIYKYIWEELGLKKIYSFETDHNEDSYGIVLETLEWKITYTGDTSPTKTLINFGKNSTLLIHENTIDVDTSEKTYDEKKHSRTQDVIAQAINTKSYRTIATHYSKKYKAIGPSDPLFLSNGIFGAFDHFEFHLSDTEWMPIIYQELTKVVSNDIHIRI